MQLCPKSVGDLMDEATEAWLWRLEAKINPNLKGISGGVQMEPIWDLVNRKSAPEWGWLEKGMLRSALANGIWPQNRLFKAGLVENGECLICGELGTLFHRIWKCPIHENYRRQYDNPLFARARNMNAASAHRLYTRPLMPVTWTTPLPLGEEDCEKALTWDIASAHGILTGSRRRAA